MFFLKEKKIVVLKQENLFCNGTISEEGGVEINNCWREKRGVKFGQASLREKFHNIQKDAKQSKFSYNKNP